jgi:hypothetical protein
MELWSLEARNIRKMVGYSFAEATKENDQTPWWIDKEYKVPS